MFKILPTLLGILLAVYIGGCTPDDYEDEVAPVHFVEVSPRSGETIAANATLTLTFDGVPIDLTSSAGKVTVDGKTVHIDGPFTSGPLEITITWADESVRLNYVKLNYTVVGV